MERSPVLHVTKDIQWCPGIWTTSAASPGAAGTGQAALLYSFYSRTISPSVEQKETIFCTCLFIYSPKEKKKVKKKKLCFHCSSCPLISLHFPCLCVCGNVHLWERAISFNVFCSCLVGPLLKPYRPPRAEKQGWKIQRDSSCKSSVVPLKSLGLPRQPEVISERKRL